MKAPFRLLRIGRKDEERTLGEDWLLIDLGENYEGHHIYLTTDHVHASEFGILERSMALDPEALGRRILEMLESEWETFNS